MVRLYCFLLILSNYDAIIGSELSDEIRGSNTTNPAVYFITPKKQVVASGSYVTMSIDVGGEPYPTANDIDWMRDDGGALPKASNDKKSILLKGIKAVNKGKYRVFVSTSAGMKVVECQVDVKRDRMSVDVIPKTSKLLQGSVAEILCSAGEIGSQYMWLKEGREITNNDRFSSYTTIDKSTLTINRIDVEDEGVYECRSWTGDKAGNNTATVIVQPAGNIPIVYISPLNVTKYMQDTFDIKMRCHIPNDPKAEFTYWEKDGKQIYGDSRREYEPSRSKLNIFDLRVEDTGSYTCVATLHNGIVVQNTTHLTVKPAITISCTDDQFLEIGKPAVIECSVKGDTQPTKFLAWMKSATTLESNAKYQISSEKSRIEITDVQPEDGGTYIVVVETSLGRKHQASSITVIINARIEESPNSLTVSTGSDISFSCTFSGTPIPYFFWNKDKKAVKQEDRVTTVTNVVQTNIRQSVLSIQSVTKLDAGVYIGIAYNLGNLESGGFESNPATLEVIDPPTINIPPRNVSLTEGKSTTIKCGFTGDKPLTVQWLYEGKALSPNDRIKPDQRGMLKFATTMSTDTGKYTCRIQNKVGVAQATALLSVRVPPMITQAPKSINVTRGGSVRLTCVADVGFPPPTISWRRNGELMVRPSFIQTRAGYATVRDVLEVEKVQQTETYTCMASNQAGSDSKEAKVAMKTVPDKPGLPIAAERDKSSIMLQWEAGHDGYAPIHQYTVMYKIAGGDWETYPTSALTNELRVTNLQPFKTYMFKVYSTNEIGSSEASIEARISTEQSVPSAPRNVQVLPISSTSAKVTWDQPLDTQGALFGYDLDYQIRGSSNNEETIHTTAQMFTLLGLEKFTQYSVRIQARNSQGAGDSSQLVHFRTMEDIPGPPLSLRAAAVTSSSVRVNWIQPLKRNGQIQYYKVYYQCTSSDCPQQFKNVETRSENPTFLLADLYKYTEYKINVAAVTGAGEGVRSANGVVFTLEDRPDGAPQGVAGEHISSSSIMISWAPPVRRNQCGVIIKYQILYKSIYAKSAETPLEVTTITQYVLKNLTKYTDYSVQIQAGTKMGYGPPSDPIIIRTGEDIPEGRPVDVETNAWSSTEINVIWRPPPQSLVHGQIIGYKVEYRESYSNVIQHVSTAADTLKATLKDLAKGKNFNICVKVQNSKGFGPCAETQQYTSPDLPSAPFIFFKKPYKRSLEVRWKKPDTPNGEITGYLVNYAHANNFPNWSVFPNITTGASETICHIKNLQPHTKYLIRVAARTSAGYGNRTVIDPVATLEDVPESSITELKGRPLNTTTISLTWMNPIKANGVIIRYKFTFMPYEGEVVTMQQELSADQAKHPTQPGLFNTSYSGLKENTLYMIKGMAFNKEGGSDWCDPISVKTTIGSPQNVKTAALSDTDLFVSWEPPQGIEQETKYKYLLEISEGEDNKDIVEITNSATFVTLNNLVVDTEYIVRVRAVVESHGNQAEGPWSKETQLTFTFISPLSIEDVVMDVETPGKLSINIDEVIPQLFRKPGLSVEVVLIRKETNTVETAPETSRKKRYTTDRGVVVYSSDDIPEGAVELEHEELSKGGTFSLVFKVLGPQGVLFESVPTSPFTVLPSTDTSNEEQVSSDQPGKSEVNPLLFLFAIIPITLICLVVTIVCIVRKQRMRKHNSSMAGGLQMKGKAEHDPLLTTQTTLERSEPYYTSSCHPPIPLSELPNVFETLSSNDYEGLIKEFESIEISAMYTYNHANAPENTIKNRYNEIVPYDYNRIKLDIYNRSDYINASYIDGYNMKKAYVATQGPVAETFTAFWRMIWEQRTATIVMVTRLVEDQHMIKCHQYWPNRGTQQRYGDLTVSALDEVSLPDFTVRKFSLQLSQGNNTVINIREVIQFQFTAWPDHGVPTYATATLAFLRKVQLTNPDEAGPIVVHCSAGVGRTGTFIVIDTMLRRIAKERDIDVFGCVSLLRTQRMHMVQTWEQYKFIYTALLEAIHCGNTEMRPSDISNRLESMSVVDSENNSCGMEIEFKRLTIHYKYSPNLFTSANLAVNHSKNRYANVLPFESTRVQLQTIPGRDGSDYINASYITGYQRRNAYIATQGPLEETVQDFWRMIWEQGVNTIVMLTQITECGRPGLSKCHEYWPSDKPLKYPMFVISHRQTNETQSFTRRELVMSNTNSGEERVVQQFHFDTWPDPGLPQSSAILGLVFQVLNNQRMQEHAPIVVHCSAGGGRTGVFIAISTAIERYHQEKLIDIFNLVKSLRNQRPAMVQTLEQYRFIYQVMSEYIESQVDGYY